MTSTIVLVLVTFLACIRSSLQATVVEGDGLWADSQVLLHMKISFVDPNNILSSWAVSYPSGSPCYWYGVICDSYHRRVIGLNLSNSDLSGSISDAIEQLVYLQTLDISNNNITGILPDQICSCNLLKFIDLSNNAIAGFIPWCLARLPSLEVINLNNNDFTGEISPEVGQFQRLRSLDIGGSYLTSNIPQEIGRISSLVNLTLAENNLYGIIPPELGNLKQLQFLYLGYNYLSGSIPAEIGAIPGLLHLDLSVNNLTGSIPSSLGNLGELRTMFLWNNSLSGPIPAELGRLPLLDSLDLSDNLLIGEIPTELSMLKSLKLLNLFRNRLSGTIPVSVAELPNLQVLSLWMNQLTGGIPSELGLYSTLQIIDLSTNLLVGPIPSTLCDGGQLTKLILFKNLLSGNIPMSLASCKSLVRVRIQGNAFSGPIPAGFGAIPYLDYLDLSSNTLSGPIDPTQFGTASFLTFLDLSYNQLSGLIPPQIGNCQSLYSLDLSNNQLTGSIPSQLGSPPNLTYLDLSDNKLNGPIPPQILSKKSLHYLNCSGNNITVPQAAATSTFGRKILRIQSFTNAVENCRPAELAASRPAAAPHSKPAWHQYVVFGGLAAVTVLATAWTLVDFRRKNYCEVRSGYANLTTSAGPPPEPESAGETDAWQLALFATESPLTIDDILDAIAPANVLGTGSAGPVYKGKTAAGNFFTVRKCADAPNQQVLGLGKLRHPNLARPLGVCWCGDVCLIASPYFSGSLASVLHGSSPIRLNWRQRFTIAVGAARGLAYLHDRAPPVVHGRVTTRHVVLTGALDAQLSVHHLHSGLADYMAPEYGHRLEMDVNSFGVVLLELLTGRERFGREGSLVEWAHKAVPAILIDHNIYRQSSLQAHCEMMKVLEVARLCTNTSAKERLSMQEVVNKLVSVTFTTNEASKKSERRNLHSHLPSTSYALSDGEEEHKEDVEDLQKRTKLKD